MGLGSYFEREQKNAPPAAPHRLEPWYDAYMDALFEYDPTRINPRIEAAEELIRRRQRELLPGPSNALERRAMKEALHALQALHFCLEH